MTTKRSTTLSSPRDIEGDYYRRLVEDTAEGILVFDREKRIVVWNQGMIRITGLPRERCVGQPVAEVLAGLGVLGVEKALASVLKGASDTLQSLSFRNGDEVRVFEANYHPVADDGGGAGGGMIVMRDITERSGVEKALIDSERKHRRRFVHAGDANLIIDRQGRYIDANPALAALTGYSVEELQHKRLSSLTPPDERPSAQAWFDELVAKGVSRSERRIRRKDGTWVYTEVHAIDLGDGTYHVSIRDIGVRREAEEQLHHALQRIRFHIERMPLGYITWSSNMEFLEWNPACERIFGWRADEILGKRWETLVPEKAIPPVGKIIDELLGGDTSSHSINENLRKDGSIITCEWFNTPLRDSQGNVSGAASMVHDVTERQIMEAQLRHTQKMESLGVLTRGIAHDFGNLLTVVLGNVTLLRNMPDVPERAGPMLELIEEASSRGTDLTEHLLAFARTGRHNPQESDLNEIVLGSLRLMRGILHGNVQVVTELGDVESVKVDRSQMEQVLINLGLNAAQAMPDGGTVTIRTRSTRLSPRQIARCLPLERPKPGPRVELSVSDTGEGIDGETINRIFDPFFSTKKGGHGLGLSAVLGILKQHDAYILTDTKLGKGTTFHVYLPIAKGE